MGRYLPASALRLPIATLHATGSNSGDHGAYSMEDPELAMPWCME